MSSYTGGYIMKIIGEDMHAMNESFVQAMEARDEKVLAGMARRQVEAGAMALDINLGQIRKFGRLTPWLVETVQEAAAVPLLLSNHVLRQQRALEIHKGRATINAVTADPDGLERAMATAASFQANLVVLLVSPQLTPADTNGRLQLAVQVVETAGRAGLPLDNIYLDPVIACRPDPATWEISAGQPDIDTLVESVRVLGELGEPRLKTIVGLSNASICLPSGQRSSFHCRLLSILAEAGLDAVIMNCRDRQLMEVAGNLGTPTARAA